MRSPALRERTEDIPILAHAFMEAFCRENGMKPKPIDRQAMDALVARKWPGNVRELKNVVERMAILSGDRVTIADMPEDPHLNPFEEDGGGDAGGDDGPDELQHSASSPGASSLKTPAPMQAPSQRQTLREYRDAMERSYIVDTLRELEWNISRAAIVLGVERTNLHKKIRAYGIKRGEG
jgi:DNA-binding NtrC family response regulator